MIFMPIPKPSPNPNPIPTLKYPEAREYKGYSRLEWQQIRPLVYVVGLIPS